MIAAFKTDGARVVLMEFLRLDAGPAPGLDK
jgi:hypothetical protein